MGDYGELDGGKGRDGFFDCGVLFSSEGEFVNPVHLFGAEGNCGRILDDDGFRVRLDDDAVCITEGFPGGGEVGFFGDERVCRKLCSFDVGFAVFADAHGVACTADITDFVCGSAGCDAVSDFADCPLTHAVDEKRCRSVC